LPPLALLPSMMSSASLRTKDISLTIACCSALRSSGERSAGKIPQSLAPSYHACGKRRWMVAVIGLLIAVLLGWITMSIGSRRIKQAEQTRVVAESKLEIAVRFAAGKAMDELRQARLALHSNNWGSAQMVLSEVRECVAFMVEVAPEGKRKEVMQLRDAVEQLQRAAEEQSKDTQAKLDALEAALDQLTRTEQGRA